MRRVTQHRQVFDHELEQQGLRRTCHREWIQTVEGLAYVSREITVKQSDWNESLTPWWKIKKTKSRRQK
jgi:hypothetical protein